MIRRPPRSTPLYSSAASDVYKRQASHSGTSGVDVFGPDRPERRRFARRWHGTDAGGSRMTFGTLAVISVIAVLGPLLALPKRWHQPVVLGELIAGILLGPTG